MATSISLVLGLCLAINLVLPIQAVIHTVGDTSGWTIGSDYSTWASSLTFVVGDSLVFNYGAGHTVDEVKHSDYKTCTTGNSLSTDSSGATTIALKTTGTHYFICAIPGHCKGGMKLAITVKAKKKAFAPAEAPSPGKDSPSDDTTSPSTTTTPSTPTTTITTPTTETTTTSPSTASNKSSATSLSPIVATLVVSWISYYVLRLV